MQLWFKFSLRASHLCKWPLPYYDCYISFGTVIVYRSQYSPHVNDCFEWAYSHRKLCWITVHFAKVFGQASLPYVQAYNYSIILPPVLSQDQTKPWNLPPTCRARQVENVCHTSLVPRRGPGDEANAIPAPPVVLYKLEEFEAPKALSDLEKGLVMGRISVLVIIECLPFLYTYCIFCVSHYRACVFGRFDSSRAGDTCTALLIWLRPLQL